MAVRDVTREMYQQIQRAAIRIVNVVEDQQDRLVLGRVTHECSDRLQEPPPVVLGVTWWSRLHVQPLTYLSDDLCHLGGACPKLFLQSLSAGDADVRAECFDKRKIGQR